jgi:hypothetical protein
MGAKICDEDSITEDAQYIRVFIPHKYKESSSIKQDVDKFVKAYPNEDYNKIRLVFFFDN